MSALSRAWRGLFLIEIPICFGTAAYWIVGGGHYVRETWALSADAGHLGLLRMQAGMLLSILVWFYGRWLTAGVRDLAAFRLFQEGLALGDVLIVLGVVFAVTRAEISLKMGLAQAVPAMLWLSVRVVFLLRTRQAV